MSLENVLEYLNNVLSEDQSQLFLKVLANSEITKFGNVFIFYGQYSGRSTLFKMMNELYPNEWVCYEFDELKNTMKFIVENYGKKIVIMSDDKKDFQGYEKYIKIFYFKCYEKIENFSYSFLIDDFRYLIRYYKERILDGKEEMIKKISTHPLTRKTEFYCVPK